MSTLLTNGASSQRGIYLAGSNGSVSQASYAYRADGRIVCETGSPKELGELFKNHRVADSVDKNSDLTRVALMIAIPIALIAAAVNFAENVLQVAGVAILAVLAAFPCYALSLIGKATSPTMRYSSSCVITMAPSIRFSPTPGKTASAQNSTLLHRTCKATAILIANAAPFGGQRLSFGSRR